MKVFFFLKRSKRKISRTFCSPEEESSISNNTGLNSDMKEGQKLNENDISGSFLRTSLKVIIFLLSKKVLKFLCRNRWELCYAGQDLFTLSYSIQRKRNARLSLRLSCFFSWHYLWVRFFLKNLKSLSEPKLRVVMSLTSYADHHGALNLNWRLD